MDSTPTPNPTTPVPARRDRAIGLAFLMSALIASLFIRVDSIEIPSLDFHATRQYRSALIARELYASEASAIREEFAGAMDAVTAAGRIGALELPIGETIAANLYRLFGRELLWLPRLVCVLAWLAGGAFLFMIARDRARHAAAIVASALYLFLPFGVVASRSFQPDPIMTAFLVAAWWAMLRRSAKPSAMRTACCGLLAASAVTIKPVALFFLVPPILALAASGRSLRQPMSDRSVYILLGLALLPALYYAFQIAIGSQLRTQAGFSVLPKLLLQSRFWVNWLSEAGYVVPLPLIALGLLSSIAFSSPLRPFLIALWTGYLGLGLVFTRHIHTHDHYSLPLIPIVALSLAPAAASAWDLIRRHLSSRTLLVSVTLGVLALAATVGYWNRHWQGVRESAAARVEDMVEIGSIVGHSAQTIVLASDFGKPLFYYGRVAGNLWPAVRYRPPGWTAAEIFADLIDEDPATHFIVADLEELERQPDLSALLRARFRPIAENRDYIIFDLRLPP